MFQEPLRTCHALRRIRPHLARLLQRLQHADGNPTRGLWVRERQRVHNARDKGFDYQKSVESSAPHGPTPYHTKRNHVGQLDKELLDRIRKCLVVFDGDAASNEQLAGRLLQGRAKIRGVLTAFFPNMLAVVKDPTHASTRFRLCHCQFCYVVFVLLAWLLASQRQTSIISFPD